MGEMFRFASVICRIWSNDHDPPHVEVFWPSIKKPEAHAKFYLDTLECFEGRGFSQKDIKRIHKELKKRHHKLKEGWKTIHGEED